MNFKQKIKAVLASLGFEAKTGRLTSEEAARVSAEYRRMYDADLAQDLAAFKEDEQRAQAYDQLSAALIGIMAEAKEGEESPENGKPVSAGAAAIVVNKEGEVSEILQSVKEIVAENKKLKSENEKMGKQALEHQAEDTVRSVMGLGGRTTDKHLFGIEHPMFALEKRWNKIAAFGRDYAMTSSADDEDEAAFRSEVVAAGRKVARRMAELHQGGLLNVHALTTEGIIDYSRLTNAGLGDQFVVRRTDALIARILALPSLDNIFPKRSYVQDQDLITNAFLGEFSQAYQEGEISKGGISFEPEKAKVHDVMFKWLIKSFKWLENTYLGYLNTSGSDPVKWNMIEWCILQIATALNNERIRRTIWGYRVDPVAGKVYHYLFGSTGLIHRLLSYVGNHQVLPFTDAELQSFTPSTIGDVMSAFVEKVADCVDDVSVYTLYLSAAYKPWYSAWYREKYAKDMDFNGISYRMHDHDVNIVFIPSMGKSQFMFMTQAGNIQQLENIPGEMNAVKFEQRLESVWAFTTWKEGVAAAFAGRQFPSQEALQENGGKDQAIFMNYPSTTLAADATKANGAANFLFKTGINTKATALTDIASAKAGIVYRIEIGDKTFPTSIAKADKFSEIQEAWEPTEVGEFIELYYDPQATKFMEVRRG